jgi:hypothetical protein
VSPEAIISGRARALLFLYKIKNDAIRTLDESDFFSRFGCMRLYDEFNSLLFHRFRGPIQIVHEQTDMMQPEPHSSKIVIRSGTTGYSERNSAKIQIYYRPIGDRSFTHDSSVQDIDVESGCLSWIETGYVNVILFIYRHIFPPNPVDHRQAAFNLF